MAKRRPVRRPVQDPLTPMSNKQMRQQATLDVQAQTAPLIADITRRINASARASSQNIEGVTSRLAGALAPAQGQVSEIYNRGIQDLSNLDARLGGALRSAPSAVAGGAAGAFQAHGGAELAALIQQRSAGESFAASLPGLARLGGAQQIGMVNTAAQKELADELGQVRSSVPGLVSNLVNDQRTREIQKAVALRDFGIDQAELLAEQRQFAIDQQRRRQEAAAARRQKARDLAEKERKAREAEADRDADRQIKVDRNKEELRLKRQDAERKKKERLEKRRHNKAMEGKDKKKKSGGGGPFSP